LAADFPAPLDCGLMGVPKAVFAFEATLVVEAIANLPVELRTMPVSHKENQTVWESEMSSVAGKVVIEAR
jgi:hypothetical protein